MTPGVPLDEDGQPPRPLFADRVADRLVAELLGVCKGLICDGLVLDGEVLGLKRWLQGRPDVTIGYPGNVIAERLLAILADGHIDGDERQELFDLMADITGETPEGDQPMNLTARAFFDDPPPTIMFDAHEFVFTGRMLYASRQDCEQEVVDRGGRAARTVSQYTDYVVTGPIGSEAWIQSTHGTKLLKAAKYREKGIPIKIVSEEHWIRALEWGA